MANYFALISILFAISITYANTSDVETVNGRIKISVGITAGNTAIGDFLRNHLLPTFEQHRSFVDLEFVPWGKTVRDANGIQTCEYGPHDCWANRFHRCVLNHLTSSAARLYYLICEFTAPFPAFAQGSYRCATEAGMRLVDADFCVNNPNRDTLDDVAEAAAAEPVSVIGTVPYVLFNNNISISDSYQAQRRLFSVVCFALADDPNTGFRSCQI